MQCVVYFERIMNTVINHVRGWNMDYHRPKRGGGLFGIVRAFAAAAETNKQATCMPMLRYGCMDSQKRKCS